jgi:H+/Cl- antiporter ClcA
MKRSSDPNEILGSERAKIRLAGVILAIELLLFEFRSRSFIPLVIACTLATSVRAILLGQRSMFSMGNGDSAWTVLKVEIFYHLAEAQKLI